MVKSLTEKWKDGELEDGYYYVVSKKWGMLIDRYKDQINDCGDEWRGFDNCQGIVDEVLAPVPTYDEWQAELDSNNELLNVQKRLEKRLEIATKAFNEIMDGVGTGKYDDYAVVCCCNDALKEMEGVK